MQDLRWPTYAVRHLQLDTAVLESAPPGKGALRVRDQAGNEYLDAVGGIGCLPLGHGHPRWIAAIEAQMRKLVAAAGTFYTEPQQTLARELARRVPLADARAFFGNTGTEVTEAALKLALRATGRDMVVAFERAFHGRTLGAVALTANPSYREPYVTCVGEDARRFAHMNVVRLPYGDLGAVQAAFDRWGDRIALVAVEPIQGEAGIFSATREFLVGLRETCTRHGALLGDDEIQSGSGRTGKFLAWSTIVGDAPEHAPDIVWLAKALGGGFPVAACVTRARLAEHMVKGSHGSTFGGNPLACAAAAATLAIFDDEDMLASAAAQAPTLRRIIEADPEPRMREYRGVGAMIGIEIAGAGNQPAASLGDAMQKLGVLVTICGGHTVRVLLPYHAGEPELREIWSALRRALAED
ncbi:MAG TPA: aminotransferase class III-fold pyridoxal phosphate-dependent enzyme [Nannocystaceae bacterium]|nr:aminotransferase class III-fold pyridoxal phosphate-dependent enzyme [Nannocystaceae bacterium]